MMLKKTAGFKISITVGIIILLIGFAVLFSIFPMLKSMDETIGLGQQISLNKIFNKILENKMKQTIIFETINANQELNIAEKTKENFWKYGNEISSQIEIGKIITLEGYNNSVEPDLELQFEKIYNKLLSIEKNHQSYQNMISDVILLQKTQNIEEINSFTGQILEKDDQINTEVNQALEISAVVANLFVEQSNSRLQESIIQQIGIIVLVGAVSIFLGYFINQINSELKQKVTEKTLELKQANTKLQELDALKDEFINVASHELKSPIQPIIGFAELAKDGDIDQKLAWDGVSDLAHKLQDLANTILDASKVERSALELNLENYSINELISSAVNTINNDPNNSASVKLRLDEDTKIELDRVRMDQVIRNLLNNSIKFTKEGIISVRTHKDLEKKIVKIIVSDTGVGIPPEILPNLFEKFATKSTKKVTTGTGLGLFLAKGIVEAHGGKIIAYNNKEKGATFEISLKIKDEILVDSITN